AAREPPAARRSRVPCARGRVRSWTAPCVRSVPYNRSDGEPEAYGLANLNNLCRDYRACPPAAGPDPPRAGHEGARGRGWNVSGGAGNPPRAIWRLADRNALAS